MAHLVFDPDEQDALRADAYDLALTAPGIAYALERLANQGVDLTACTDWEDVRLERGLPPRTSSAA